MTEIFDEDSVTPATEHFGLTRIGENEALSKNGWAFGDADRVQLDRLLYALFNAPRDGTVRLSDPEDEATASVSTGDGSLPGGTSFYYSYAFIDKWGLETAVSPEVEVITNDPIEGPVAASYTIQTSGGTLVAGYYSYAITAITASGEETTADYQTDVRINSGSTNQVTLDLPDLPAGATAFRIYRARPGQEDLYYLDEDSGGTYVDDGGETEDTTITPPTFNDTNSSCSVEVTLPSPGVPEGCFGWKLYRTLEAGVYDGYNLVHTITEGVSELDSTPVDTYVDIGDGLLQGQPRVASATVGGGASLGFGGTDPDDPNSRIDPELLPRGTLSWDAYEHTVVVREVIARRTVTEPMGPIQMDVQFGDAPTTATDGAQIGFEVVDGDGNQGGYVGADGTDVVGYSRTMYPNGYDLTFQAETTAVDDGDVTIATNESATEGRVVEINADDESVDFELDLDPGIYYFNMSYALQDDSDGPTNDLRVQILDLDDDTIEYLDMTFTAPAGPALSYMPAANLQIEIPTDVGTVGVRITKLTATAATYHIDEFLFTGSRAVLESEQVVFIRATLVDPPGVDPLPKLEFVGPRLSAPERRIWGIAGVDATVTIPLKAGAGVAWTASSSEAWAVPTASGTGDTAVSVAINYSSLSAGDREVALITFEATSHEDCVVEVVALKAPSDLGARASISVLY